MDAQHSHRLQSILVVSFYIYILAWLKKCMILQSWDSSSFCATRTQLVGQLRSLSTKVVIKSTMWHSMIMMLSWLNKNYKDLQHFIKQIDSQQQEETSPKNKINDMTAPLKPIKHRIQLSKFQLSNLDSVGFRTVWKGALCQVSTYHARSLRIQSIDFSAGGWWWYEMSWTATKKIERYWLKHQFTVYLPVASEICKHYHTHSHTLSLFHIRSLQSNLKLIQYKYVGIVKI